MPPTRSSTIIVFSALASVSCVPATPPSQEPVDVHVSAPSSASASRPPLLETPFVKHDDVWYANCLRVAAPGRMIIGHGSNLLEHDGAHLQQRSDSEENPVDGVPHSCGVGPTGDLFLLTSTLIGNARPWYGHGKLYRLVSRAWVIERDLGPYHRGLDIVAWSKGRWLLLEHEEQHPWVSFRAPESSPDLPRLTPATFDPKASAIEPTDFAALSTGEVVVVGRLRRESNPKVTLGNPGDEYYRGFDQPEREQGAWERFTPGSSNGVLERLTWRDDHLLPCCVRLRGPAEAWVAGTTSRKHGFVGKWDGRAWKFADVDEPVRAFDVEPDGTIWVGTETKIKRGALDKPFETVPLPKLGDEAPIPRLLVAAGAQDVWMLLESGRAQMLFRTKPLPPLEKLPVSDEEKKARSRRSDPPQEDREASSEIKGCKELFVTIQERSGIAEIDYSSVASALKGHGELAKAWFIEYAHKGARHFGARVPDAATGRKLVAALASAANVAGGAGAKNLKPKLVCFVPAATKRIEFDFKNGTVAGSGPP